MIQSFVFTGYLGSGKTTLMLASIQRYFNDKKVAVVVNEFGDIGIDGAIVQNVHSQVVEISEGCICCQLAQEFEAGVTEVVETYNPEVLFVEASGASEPFPIYLSLQNLGMSVEGVVCVIDTKHFDLYKEESTARYQIGGSNILVLNKVDTVDTAIVNRVASEVRGIKEQYNLKNTLTDQSVFRGYLMLKAQNGEFDRNPFDGLLDASELLALGEDAHDHQHHHTDGLAQKVAYIDASATWNDVHALLHSVPDNIVRIKGIILTHDMPKPVALHYVFGDVTFEELEAYEGKSVLVFIGEDAQNTVLNMAKQFDFLRVPKFHV